VVTSVSLPAKGEATTVGQAGKGGPDQGRCCSSDIHGEAERGQWEAFSAMIPPLGRRMRRRPGSISALKAMHRHGRSTTAPPTLQDGASSSSRGAATTTAIFGGSGCLAVTGTGTSLGDTSSPEPHPLSTSDPSVMMGSCLSLAL
jgi:hypothetical protein